MSDSPDEKRVKQAVGDVIRKYSYPSGAIDMPGDEARRIAARNGASFGQPQVQATEKNHCIS